MAGILFVVLGLFLAYITVKTINSGHYHISFVLFISTLVTAAIGFALIGKAIF